MLGVILRVIAFLLFLLAGFNQTLFNRTLHELVAFGLAAWVLATLVGWWGPPAPWGARTE
jgi:hypothetical protein